MAERQEHNFFPMVQALLDSNQLILHVNGEQQIDFCSRVFAISSLSIFECLCFPGMTEAEEREMREIVSLCEIISLSKYIAFQAAAIARTRKTLRPIDFLIAATALELGVPLITENIKDFKGIPNLTVLKAL